MHFTTALWKKGVLICLDSIFTVVDVVRRCNSSTNSRVTLSHSQLSGVEAGSIAQTFSIAYTSIAHSVVGQISSYATHATQLTPFVLLFARCVSRCVVRVAFKVWPTRHGANEEIGDAWLGAKGQFIMFDEPVSKVRPHHCEAGCFSAAGDDGDDADGCGGGGVGGADAVSDVCSVMTSPPHRYRSFRRSHRSNCCGWLLAEEMLDFCVRSCPAGCWNFYRCQSLPMDQMPFYRGGNFCFLVRIHI